MNVKTALEYIAFFVVFCVIFSLVGVVSVSAASSNNVTFSDNDMPYSVTSSSGYVTFPLYSYSGAPTYYELQQGTNVYFFMVGTGNSKALCAVSTQSQTILGHIVNGASFWEPTLSEYGSTGVYYALGSSSNYPAPNWYIPLYSTLNAGLDDFVYFVNNPPVSAQSLNYSLPPGNAIYIQVPSGASYTLGCRMPESVLGTNHYPGNNQAVTLVQSLPSGGSAPSSPLIPWAQIGALSYLGLSRNATYSASVASSGYLCIVNPLYYSGTANGPYEFLSNGAIDISIDLQTGFWVYPLDSTLGFTSGLGLDVSTEVLDTPYTGSIDPDTGEITWEDSDGGSSAPTTGGGNLVDTSETIFDFLRNISQELSTFLKGPVSAIQTVVSSIRDFMSSFTQLYTWLPSPVYNLITSALMIALTIGVIKIFI